MYLAGDIGRGINAAFKQVNEATRSLGSGTFTVNKDNVLAAARIVESQADSLKEQVKDIRRDLEVNPPGNDQVSTRMAAAWNDLLINDEDSYRNRINDYITGLKKLAVQLGDTARAYGFSEEEIEAAFRKTGA
ncbi:hypothetical protein [Actinophytocola sp. NPDC049390]|uniref:hypothetical protein n=1 Tax=Actinophytocola sp. NPDC049390 TaxID=3363894 RepID=UPI00379FEA5F